MAETLSYGAQLPDQAQPLLNHIQSVLSFYADVEKFTLERAALEREFGQKLQALTKRMMEKKAKRGDSLWTGELAGHGSGLGDKCTLSTALDSVLNFTEEASNAHVTLADQLTKQVADVLREKEKRKEVIRTRYGTYYQELLDQRDKYYQDRLKTKQKYQEACNNVEAARIKHDRSAASGDRHVDRAHKSFLEAKDKAGEAKNAFIIQTGIANKMKEKFYRIDLPAFEDKLRKNIHFQNCDNIKDLELFVRCNTRVGSWQEPPDWVWEPAEGLYEVGVWCLDPGPKIVLQNRLARSAGRIESTSPVLHTKQTELTNLIGLVGKYSADPSLGDPDKIMEGILGNLTEVATLDNQVAAGHVVADLLQDALGDDQGSLQPHDFKSSSFTIPTHCAHCKQSIWGLSKQGKTCKACGITVHSKCELKIPSNCRSTPALARRSSMTSNLTRSSSSASRASGFSAPRGNNASHITANLAPSVFEEEEEGDSFVDGGRETKVLFDYEATSESEISIREGRTVRVIEEDDGSGWVKVDDGTGYQGLCPAAYLEVVDTSPKESSAATTTNNVRDQGDNYVMTLRDPMNSPWSKEKEFNSHQTGGTTLMDAVRRMITSACQALALLFSINHIT
ncbi:Cdc42-interacting protein CIP4 [Phaffia rhodozyma]|uniref:Cdc42-interacting protein CIP4 n=1 Tax=Phaffia rhodozyma TaxID=264483 RepID=A0A0F7STE0_PHARH|nr:Cdc42-interacting protein CIP4 [Phaffia rhodozyma]